MKLSDYPPFDVDAVASMFKQWEQHKTDDILGFRDKHGFKSVVTGCISPPHHTKWIDELDDSMDSFLKSKT